MKRYLGLVICLIHLDALGQFEMQRQFGLIGFEVFEPLGMDGQYFTLVDEWGTIEMPRIAPAGMSRMLRISSWEPNPSSIQMAIGGVLRCDTHQQQKSDGILWEVQSESIARSGISISMDHLSEKTSLHFSGLASFQKYPPAFLAQNGLKQPLTESRNIYAYWSQNLQENLILSIRTAQFHSASLYTNLTSEDEREVLQGLPLESILSITESQIPTRGFWGYQDGSTDCLAHLDVIQNSAIRLSHFVDSTQYNLTATLRSSRWYQRVSRNIVDLETPIGPSNFSIALEGKRILKAGKLTGRIQNDFHNRNAELSHLTTNQSWWNPNLRSILIDPVTFKMTSASAVFEAPFLQGLINSSFTLSFNRLYGFLPSAHCSFKSSQSDGLSLNTTLSHGWRLPEPFKHEWKSMLNTDAINAQDNYGHKMALPSQFAPEIYSAIQTQIGWRKENALSIHELKVQCPIAFAHRAWNMDVNGHADDYSDNSNLAWGRSGIQVSYQPRLLAATWIQYDRLTQKGLGYSLSAAINRDYQFKGLDLNPAYLMPLSRLSFEICQKTLIRSQQELNLSLKIQRLGKMLVSQSEYLIFHSPQDGISFNEDVWAEPWVSYALGLTYTTQNNLKINIANQFNTNTTDNDDFNWDWGNWNSPHRTDLDFYEQNFMQASRPLARFVVVISISKLLK